MYRFVVNPLPSSRLGWGWQPVCISIPVTWSNESVINIYVLFYVCNRRHRIAGRPRPGLKMAWIVRVVYANRKVMPETRPENWFKMCVRVCGLEFWSKVKANIFHFLGKIRVSVWRLEQTLRIGQLFITPLDGCCNSWFTGTMKHNSHKSCPIYADLSHHPSDLTEAYWAWRRGWKWTKIEGCFQPPQKWDVF